jgi:nitrogen fixation NifU-like protein
MSLDMYQENILDHYENPRNYGNLKDKDVTSHDKNPLCGDVFDMDMKFKDGKVHDIKFTGHGCAISTASASMLSEKLIGMQIEEAKKLEQKDIVGIKCAMLPLKVAKLGIYDFIGKKVLR